MSWTHQQWSQYEGINYGYPYTSIVSPPSYNNAKTVWTVNGSYVNGYPYVDKSGISTPNYSNVETAWKITPLVNFDYPYIKTLRGFEPPPQEEPLIFYPIYKIYYNNTLFYRSDLPIPELKIPDPILSLKANSAGSLEFTLAKENTIYNIIKRMRGIVKVTKSTNINPTEKTIFEGRVLSDETDFWGNKKTYCEGILACLNDTRHPQHVYKSTTTEVLTLRRYMESLLSIHNQKVDSDKKFEIGIVTVNDNLEISSRATSYESTWELFKALVDEYGGYLFVRYDGSTRYIDYRKECPRTSSQKIEFGVNLVDFSRNYDMSSLCTVLLPLGTVIASAGTNTIGEKVDALLADAHFISDVDFDIYYDPNLSGAYAGSNTYFQVQAGKTYYISCRNHDGRIMWALKDSGGNLVDYYAASTGEGFTDLIEYKLEVPPSDVGNPYLLAIAGFGQDIQPRVNASIEADESFDKYTTVEEATNGSVYVINQDAVTTYGWIEKQLSWDNIDSPAELKRVAEAYLTNGQFDEMTLELSAIDLQMMGVNADEINILDEVWVVSTPHGLNKTFPVTELTINMAEPSANKFTLGSKTEQTLSGVMTTTNDDLISKINALPSQSSTLKSARDNATQLINNATSGIFTLEYDNDGVNTGFRISNVSDWSAEGARGWRFNIGGIAYYGNGFNQPVTLALTGPDGGIVANSITTGQMLATRIKGGTLGLGHWQMEDGSYIDGDLQIADRNGNIIVSMNQNGAFVKGVIESVGQYVGIGPQVVHIEDGWIYGSDINAGHISVDTNIDDDKGISIETDVLALLAGRVYVGRNRDGSDLEETVGYQTLTVTGTGGTEVDLIIKDGFVMLADEREQDPDYGLEARISDLEDRVAYLESIISGASP